MGNNDQNLIPLTSERAREIGKIGASQPKPHVSWLMQKWCNKNCLFRDRCPAISTSQAAGKINGKYPCFIKKQPQEVQHYFWSLFSEGEEGLIKVIMDLHFRLMLKTQSAKITSKELREAIECSLNMKKGIYGDKQKIEHSGNIPIQIIIERPEKTNGGTNTDNSLEAN